MNSSLRRGGGPPPGLLALLQVQQGIPSHKKTDLMSLDQIAYGGERSVIQYILVNTLIDIKSPRGETEPTASLGKAPRSREQFENENIRQPVGDVGVDVCADCSAPKSARFAPKSQPLRPRPRRGRGLAQRRHAAAGRRRAPGAGRRRAVLAAGFRATCDARMLRAVFISFTTFAASMASFVRLRFIAGGEDFDVINPWPKRWRIGGATSSSDLCSRPSASSYESNFSPQVIASSSQLFK